MTRCSLLALGVLLGWMLAAGAQDSASIKADEDLLRAADIKTTGPGLLELIKRRTLKDVDRKHIEALVKQLGDEEFATREQATQELNRISSVAVPHLQKAAQSSDPEQARRAEQCLQSIQQQKSPALIGAAVRLLAVRRPAGAVEALLGYLPSASDAGEMEEISRALSQLGVRAGKADPLLVQALTDKDAVKRGVAGAALARAGLAGKEPNVRLLLADREAEVRLRVGLALVEAREKEALPVLIHLLKDLPAEQTDTIEELLYYLAGDKAPGFTPGNTPKARPRRHEAWLGWWKEHGGKLSLDKFDPEMLQRGYTLLVFYQAGINGGSVQEIDKTGKVRWQINQLNMPVDAQMLPGERVLIAEYRSRLVSERDLTGRILWQYNANGLVMGARRLANGNTLVTMRTGVVEVDRDSKEIWRFNSGNICAACKLSNGSVAVATLRGQLIRLNAEGKQTSIVALGGSVMSMGSSLAAGPNGRVLVPLYNQNKVVELDAEGKQVWETTVSAPTSVQRLPGNRILVTSRPNRLALEIDRAGKTVWQHEVEGTQSQLMKATRR